MFHVARTLSGAVVSRSWRITRDSSKLHRAGARTGDRKEITSSISSILQRVEGGKLTAAEAESMLRTAADDSLCRRELQPPAPTPTSKPASDTDEALSSFANLDHSRALRTGFPEAVFAQGKTPPQIVAILDSMTRKVNESVERGEIMPKSAGGSILATRVDRDLWADVASIGMEDGVGTMTYHETGRMISVKASALSWDYQGGGGSSDGDEAEERDDGVESQPRVVVACAGTTDLPIAEEAALTLEHSGVAVDRVYDVGVAGLHRVIGALPTLRIPSVKCVIVCAGMDGALPSVVAGLVQAPVVAVPTSVGYGASFGGVSALLTMLNSCAPGVGVVNIDNGFGAAALAFKLL